MFMYENKGLMDFFEKNTKRPKLFILGDTASGKSTGTLNYFLSNKNYYKIFYITTRKADLSEKREYILENFKSHTVVFHDKPNNTDVSIGQTIEGEKTKYTIHLMSVEKALFFMTANLSNDNEVNNMPDLFILDEIDSITENQNYEILTALINGYFPHTKTIYISAVVDIKYIKTKLARFFMFDNPELSCYDMGKNNKKIATYFYEMKESLQKELDRYLVMYANNKWRYGPAIFIVPSIPKIENLVSNKKMMNIGLFSENKTISSEIKNIEKSLIANKNAPIETIVKQALSHNFGIIYSKIQQSGRATVLNLFNSGKLPIIIATNAIERGINLRTKTLFLFETKTIKWTNQQIINFYGRINRERINKNEKDTGYFFFISSIRKSYDFSIIEKRNQEITSCLNPRRAFMFLTVFDQLADRFIDANIKSKVDIYKTYKKYSDGINFSLLEDAIFPNKENFDYILSNKKDNWIDKETIIRKTLSVVENSQQLYENMIRYLYVKTITALQQKDIELDTAKRIVEILCNIILEQNRLITFRNRSSFRPDIIKKELKIVELEYSNKEVVEHSIFRF